MVDVSMMTPEQVTAQLAEMKKNFDAVERDRQFGAQPKAAPAAPAADTDPKTLDDVLAANRDAAEKRDAENVLDHLIKAGLSPEITEAGAEVQQYIEGKRSITPQLRAAVDAKIESWKRDGEFQKKLLSGDPESARLLNIASAMRIAPVQEAKKTENQNA